MPLIRARSAARAGARANVTGQVVDTVTNIKTVKLFAHDGHEDQAALTAMEGFRDAALDHAGFCCVSLLAYGAGRYFANRAGWQHAGQLVARQWIGRDDRDSRCRVFTAGADDGTGQLHADGALWQFGRGGERDENLHPRA